MLAYGVSSVLVGEYLRMNESTCIDSMCKICKAVMVVFDEVHLREPIVDGTVRLLSINGARDFRG
jgi:hypothetical protein